MIRFRLKELIAQKEYEERRVITLAEIANDAGVHRATLSKIANEWGANPVTANVDKLCRYFGCQVGDFMEYVPDADS